MYGDRIDDFWYYLMLFLIIFDYLYQNKSDGIWYYLMSFNVVSDCLWLDCVWLFVSGHNIMEVHGHPLIITLMSLLCPKHRFDSDFPQSPFSFSFLFSVVLLFSCSLVLLLFLLLVSFQFCRVFISIKWLLFDFHNFNQFVSSAWLCWIVFINAIKFQLWLNQRNQ
jgi:hypothetical protein